MYVCVPAHMEVSGQFLSFHYVESRDHQAIKLDGKYFLSAKPIHWPIFFLKKLFSMYAWVLKCMYMYHVCAW